MTAIRRFGFAAVTLLTLAAPGRAAAQAAPSLRGSACASPSATPPPRGSAQTLDSRLLTVSADSIRSTPPSRAGRSSSQR